MNSELRREFNARFEQARYEAFVTDINRAYAYPADFKISETPLFLTRALTNDLLSASESIISQLENPDYLRRAAEAIPPGWAVPGESEPTTFLQLDFALCRDASGQVVPRLIELQGFPSLYAFQAALDLKTRQYFDLPPGLAFYFDGLDYASYRDLLRQVIVADSDPEHVILMDLEPEKQKTRIDFACTEALLGIRSVCVTKIIERGGQLFYRHGEREIRIERIYNRLIRDDLDAKGVAAPTWLSQAVHVHWVGHPNWYFKISKFSLPLLHGPIVPETHFADQFVPADLENYVLKPLFSFSGSGVELDVTAERLAALPDRHNFILQRKVEYAPLVETPDGLARAEVRMLFVRDGGRLRPACSLVRLSKGRMMGVRFNKDKTWVGSTLAYYPV